MELSTTAELPVRSQISEATSGVKLRIRRVDNQAQRFAHAHPKAR
jgi:hypothetical protein